MFYTQVVLSGIFFLNYDNYPKINKKILILGAGAGNLNYFFDKVFMNNADIDAVEIDQKIIELGRDYFGFNNFKKENIKKSENNNINWYIQDAKTFIEEKDAENYYDLIIMNIHNTEPIKERSPPNIFFEEKIMKNINKIIKPEGIYIMYLMCKNKIIHEKSVELMKKFFKNIISFENNDELNKIYFCFKSKIKQNEIMKNYSANITNLSELKDIIDIKIIRSSSLHLMNKFNNIILD